MSPKEILMSTVSDTQTKTARNDFDSDRTLARAKDALAARGHHDGYAGLEQHAPDALVDAFAMRRVERSESFKRNELAEIKAGLRESEAERRLYSDRFDEALQSSAEMQRERRKHPFRYSWMLGAAFLFVSFILLLADFRFRS